MLDGPRLFTGETQICSWWADYLPADFAGGFYPESNFNALRPLQPIYPYDQFHEVFRIPFEMFVRIEADLRLLWDGGEDCTHTMGMRAPIKILTVLRLLGHDRAARDMDDHARIGASTILNFRKEFCKLIIRVYGPRYLQPATREEMMKLAQQHADIGLPGSCFLNLSGIGFLAPRWSHQ